MKNARLLSICRQYGIVAKNRIVSVSVNSFHHINNIPNRLMKKYYKQLANSEFIIAEVTSPSPNGFLPHIRNLLRKTSRRLGKNYGSI